MDLRNQQIKETYGNLATINTVAGTPTTGVLQNGAGSNVTAMTLEGSLTAQQLNADNLRLDGNTISSTDTNGNVTIDPNGTGSTVLVGDLLVDDKIIHSGDTNTAIRFPSADTVTVETAGSERLRIDSSGNVGIGVTPSAWNTAGDTKALQISTVTAVGEAYDTAFISANWYLVSGPLEKYIGNGIASRMTLSSDPNGKNISLSTAPNNTSGAGASLTWKERFGMNLTEAVINDASEDYDFRVEGATDTHLIFADAGNDRVGIGTSSPAVKLDVSGQVRASTGILFGTDTAAANALDDYDSGTYTATITCSTSGTITLNSLFDQLSYTKIGRLMTITGSIAVTSVSSPTGAIYLSLPTAISDLSETAGRIGGFIPIFNTSTDVNNFLWYALESDSYIVIRKGGSTAGTDDSAQTFSGDETIYINLSYVSA